MIRKILLSTVALCAVSSAALAADLPSRRAPPVYVAPIPVFSWTGFYIGGQVGFAFGKDRANVVAPPALAGINGSVQPNGIIGGGHIGYNFALPGFNGIGGAFGGSGLVFGAEVDIDGTDYRGTIGNAAILAASIRSQVQGSARGRVGVAFDRALFYATGGAAFTQFQTTYAAPGAFAGFANTRVGWTVGGGVEYAITTQWSLRAEYRYADFGSFTDRIGAVAIRHRETVQRAQVGFSYKFDTPAAAPVVARY